MTSNDQHPNESLDPRRVGQPFDGDAAETSDAQPPVADRYPDAYDPDAAAFGEVTPRPSAYDETYEPHYSSFDESALAGHADQSWPEAPTHHTEWELSDRFNAQAQSFSGGSAAFDDSALPKASFGDSSFDDSAASSGHLPAPGIDVPTAGSPPAPGFDAPTAGYPAESGYDGTTASQPSSAGVYPQDLNITAQYTQGSYNAPASGGNDDDDHVTEQLQRPNSDRADYLGTADDGYSAVATGFSDVSDAGDTDQAAPAELNAASEAAGYGDSTGAGAGAAAGAGKGGAAAGFVDRNDGESTSGSRVTAGEGSSEGRHSRRRAAEKPEVNYAKRRLIAVIALVIGLALIAFGVYRLVFAGGEDKGDTPSAVPAATSSSSAVPTTVTTAATTEETTTTPAQTTSETTSSAPATTTTEQPASQVDRSIPVTVLNNSTVQGLAASTAQKLAAQQWTSINYGNLATTGEGFPRTVVLYDPSNAAAKAAAEQVATDLGVTAQARTSAQASLLANAHLLSGGSVGPVVVVTVSA